MNERFVIAGPDHGQLIRQLGRLLEEIGNLDAGLASLLERPAGLHELCFEGVDLRQQQLAALVLRGKQFAVPPGQGRLGIEAVDLAQPSLQEEEDDTLRFGGEMRLLGA